MTIYGSSGSLPDRAMNDSQIFFKSSPVHEFRLVLGAVVGTSSAFLVEGAGPRIGLIAATLLLSLGFIVWRRRQGVRGAAPDLGQPSEEVRRAQHEARVEQLMARFQQVLSEFEQGRDDLEGSRKELAGSTRRRTADLLRRNRELKKLDQLKDEFVSLLAHELRTPLTSVRSYVELLIGYGDRIDGAESQEFLCIVRSQVQRISRLVNELLDLSRLRAGRFQFELAECRVDAVVNEAVDSLRKVAENERHLIQVLGLDDEVVAFCDRERLTQILTNLLGNALKYSPDGSLVRVEALATDGNQVTLAVDDSGPGIPEAERELVFEPFYRTRSLGQSNVEGTGLGLYLSRELARQMDGDLLLEHSMEGGARFLLTLPATGAETAGRSESGQFQGMA